MKPTLGVVVLALSLLACDSDAPAPAFGPGDIPGSLTPSAANQSDRVGSAVAMTQTWVAIGSPGDDTAGPEAGAVYLYRNTGLSLEPVSLLTRPEDGVGWEDRFGNSVATDGTLLVIGAPGVDLDNGGEGRNTGAVYLYSLSEDGATFVDILTSPAPFVDQAFGTSVAVAGDLLLVGAPGVDFDRRDVGTVVAFRRVDGAFAVADDAALSE